MRLLSGVLLFLCCSLHAVAAVTGQVIDEDGKPLRGARVRAFALETHESFLDRITSDKPAPVALTTAETADDGAFRVDTKPPVIVLLADAPGRAYAQMEVPDGEEVTIVLRNASLRRGKVTAAGRGVANATLIADRLVVVRTGEDGSYELPDPSVWANRIYVVHRDYAIADLVARSAKPDIELNAGRAIRGSVVGAGDKPVANAVVRLNGFPLARSGDDGMFTIAHAARDARTISASTAERTGSAELTGETVTIRTAHVARLTGIVRNAKDETPVAGARVSAGAVMNARFEAITDAKGNFTIDGIEPGLLRLGASHPAFLSSSTELHLPAGSREHRVLSATPLARLRGVVVDESKKPVAAARVRVTNSGWSAMTSTAGTFSVRVPLNVRGTSIEASKRSYASALWGPVNLEPGEVRSDARIVLSRGLSFAFHLADADGVAIAGEPLILLRSGDSEGRFLPMPILCERGADADECRSDASGNIIYTLAEGKYTIRAGGNETVQKELPNQMLTADATPMAITLARGAPVEGRVTWADDAPIDVPVTVSTSARPPIMTRTTDGTFAMRNTPPGKVLLFARTEGPSSLQSEAIEVNAPATGVVLKIPRPGRIEGRVVERATDKPVTDFQVMTNQREQRAPGRPKPFRADDGKFLLDGVTPGSVDVVVTAPGFVRATIGDVEVESGKTATVSVALERGGSVAGRVTSEGKPVADAMVVVEEKSSGFRAFVRPNTQSRADGNGEYRIDGVAPGAQRIQVQREGYAPKVVDVKITAGSEARADAELERGIEVRGRVLDSEGRPLGNVEVMVRSTAMSIGGPPVRTTDASGEFRLPGLAAATYRITARPSGFAEETIEVNPSTTPEITITLRRGATITGRVLGVPEADLPFVDLHVSNTPTRVQPDATGAFTISGVADGDVVITAIQQRPRVRQVRSKIRVTNGVAPPVDLDFSAQIVVSGRVTREGKPLTYGRIAFVPAVPASGGSFAHAQIERDGSYEVSFPAPGEYEVQVDNISIPSKVSVRESMRHDIDLRGATITGRVVDALTREPVSDARVILEPDRSEQRFSIIEDRSDASGKFSLSLVSEGRWLVIAQKDDYAPERREIFVQNERAPEVEIPLTRGVPAMLRVLAPDGVAIDASISVSDESGQSVFSGWLSRDASGVHRLVLKPGRYKIHAFAPNHKSANAVLVVPGPLVEIRLEKP